MEEMKKEEEKEEKGGTVGGRGREGEDEDARNEEESEKEQEGKVEAGTAAPSLGNWPDISREVKVLIKKSSRTPKLSHGISTSDQVTLPLWHVGSKQYTF